MLECVGAALRTVEAVHHQAAWANRVVPEPERDVDGRTPAHALWMAQEIIEGRVTGNKAHRWLGYLQGILVVSEWVDLHEMKDANKQASESERAA